MIHTLEKSTFHMCCGIAKHDHRTRVRPESSVQSLSHVQLFVTPWTAARQASLSITNSQSSLKLTSMGVSDAIQPSHPLSLTGALGAQVPHMPTVLGVGGGHTHRFPSLVTGAGRPPTHLGMSPLTPSP